MKYPHHSSSLMIDLVGHKLYLTRKQSVFMKYLQIYIISSSQPTKITVSSQYQTILSFLRNVINIYQNIFLKRKSQGSQIISEGMTILDLAVSWTVILSKNCKFVAVVKLKPSILKIFINNWKYFLKIVKYCYWLLYSATPSLLVSWPNRSNLLDISNLMKFFNKIIKLLI